MNHDEALGNFSDVAAEEQERAYWTRRRSYRFGISEVCTSFEAATVGTKVLDRAEFLDYVGASLAAYDEARDMVPGQHIVNLPEGATKYVSAGVGTRDHRPDSYGVRAHRGRCEAFLKREFAARCTGVAVVVYTIDAYARDPEVGEVEMLTLREAGTTHVIVAVLGFAGPAPALAPYRLMSNLAGGNREADVWTLEDVRAKAQASKAYDDAWCVVAD